MTACFYDTRGGMVGLDKHIHWRLEKSLGVPGIVIGLPSEKRHLVHQAHFPCNNSKHTFRVTSEDNFMLKKDFSMIFIPHIPLTTDLMSVLGVSWLLVVIARSKSEPFMHMPSVTGEGTPLACCIHDMFGLNLNCEGYGVVINPNSVVTSPSLADFAQVLLGFAYNKALDWLVGKAIGLFFPGIPVSDGKGKSVELPNPIAEVLKWLFDEHVKKELIDPLVEPQIKDIVDGL